MTQAMQVTQAARAALGEELIQRGLLNVRDLDRALAAQREMGGRIGEVLVRLGLVAETDLFKVLAEHLDVTWVQKDDFPTSRWIFSRCRWPFY